MKIETFNDYYTTIKETDDQGDRSMIARSERDHDHGVGSGDHVISGTDPVITTLTTPHSLLCRKTPSLSQQLRQ